MQPQTVAILLLLVVCAVVSPHPVIGGKKRLRCDENDKKHILKDCGHYTKKHGHSNERPATHSSCCAAVHTVPDDDMQCIVDLLTDAEKKEHEKDAILALQDACA
uniref:Bifunctional inhibitor/plant lipid transfer protein/seed storage helical domain-containing protein n=1 Tax=Setaria viridis TaxID=4556 RepID=A0A4U6TCZ6_SETVI|nr:hypothetical protein SEVIR_8G078800v2 [Setaria viridis]